MKIAFQILLCLVGLFAAYLLFTALLGAAIHATLLCAILAAIIGLCRWQANRWQSRRLPSQRAVQKIERNTEKALTEMERKVNKS